MRSSRSRAAARAPRRPAASTSATGAWSASTATNEESALIGSILALALIAQTAPVPPTPELVTPLNAAAPPACDTPGRAPDPRCNDNLDGREPPESSPARRAAQTALAPPRAAARLVLLPVVE